MNFIDTETFSELDLKKVGHAKYFEHPSTRTMIVTYQIGLNGETKVWDVEQNPFMPEDLLHEITETNHYFYAFNAPFDYAALMILMEQLMMDLIPFTRFRCLAVAAMALGFNGSLDDVLERFNIPHRKTREGKRLILKFCKPQPTNHNVRLWSYKNAPEDWAKFVEYALQDTRVLPHLFEKIKETGIKVNWEEYYHDYAINTRGLPIDMDLVEMALLVADYERESLLDRMQEITGIENPNSTPQLKKWLEDDCDVPMPNMQKATLQDALKCLIPDDARRAIEIKQKLSKTSTSKWDALGRAVCDDGRIRFTHQYIGAARTGRDAHRIFQPGNLPRGTLDNPTEAAELLLEGDRDAIELAYGDVMQTLSNTLRSAITAPEGQLLVAADLSGIEGCTLPWQCDFEEKLDSIRKGENQYLKAAADIYNIPYEQLTKKSPEYMPGKIAELALGYQGAYGALNALGLAYGMSFTEADARKIVVPWRKKNKPIVDYWHHCQMAVRQAINNPGKRVVVKHVAFEVKGDFLYAILPSGRKLSYYKPQYDNGFTYMGLNTARKWVRLDSYGGKIVENLTQAIARDVFFHGLRLYAQEGGQIILRVHDEMVATVPEDRADVELAKLIDCMTVVPEWAKGLPLKAGGFVARRYKK